MTVFQVFVTLVFGALVMDGYADEQREGLKALNAMRAQDFFHSPLQVELVEAVIEGEIEKTKAILLRGAEINYVGKDGVTPLIWTMIKQDLRGFENLLELGADPNQVTMLHDDPGGQVNPMDLAAETPDHRYLAALLEHDGNPNLSHERSMRTPLFTAVLRRQPRNIRLLIDAGADIDHLDLSKSTPLHYAVSANIFDMALVLLSNGADPSIENRWGYDVIDTLERFGAKGVGENEDNSASYRLLIEKLGLKGLSD